jgi:ribosomal protein S3
MCEQPSDKKRITFGELAVRDKECRLRSLEQDLVAALSRPTVKLDITEVRNKGLFAFLQAYYQPSVSRRR